AHHGLFSLLLLLSYVSVLAHAVSLPSHYTSISRDEHMRPSNLWRAGRSVVVLDQKGRLGGHVETYIDVKGAPHNVGVTVYYNNTINNAYFLHCSAVFLDLATGKTVPRGFVYPCDASLCGHTSTLHIHISPSRTKTSRTRCRASCWIPSRSSTDSRRTSGTCGAADLPRHPRRYLQRRCRVPGPGDVFLNSTILDVDRSGACFGVQETAGSGICVLSTSPSLSSSANVTTLIKARKLLVAIPPSLRTLTAAHLDLDAHERFLFAKLHAPTTTSAPTHPTNLLTLPGAFSYSPLPAGRFTSWFGTFEDHGFLDDDVEALIRGEIRRMVAHGTAAGNPNDVTFEFLKIHAPFRLNSDLYALEGRRNTFWTGAAWSEQDSSQIWWWSELSLLPKMEAALRAR
ncbi:hypothetical protein B0H14DRAFT_3006075, partial [Mycena olivaceomarginata]